MELRTTQRLRRSGQAAKSTTKKPDGESAPAGTQPARPQFQTPADRLTVSQQALTWLDRQIQLDRERELRRQAHQSNGLSALEHKKQALDDLDRKLKVLSKCQKIAASIMKGNRVPPEDLAYLMEHDSAGYKLAMAMRRHNPDPKDVESVLDEEDKTHDTGDISTLSAAVGLSGGDAEA